MSGARRTASVFVIAGLAVASALALSRREGRPGGRASLRRVVVPSPAVCELAFAIGAGDRVAGVSRFCDEPEAVRSLPNVGGIIDPNLEAISALAPDGLLLQGRFEKLEQLAATRGWTVETFTIESLADIDSALARLGTILDAEEGARRERDRLARALALARESRPTSRPRTLVSINRTSAGDLGSVATIGGQGTFLDECLDAAGAEPVFRDLPRGYPMVSKEAIVERRPELVVELLAEPVDQAVEKRLAADWKALPGISPRVVVIAGSETLVPGPRVVRLLERLSKAVRGEGGP